MRADERARVPFALIGVLLLVSSATVATTMGPGEPTTDPAVENTVDRATATVAAELRDAVDTAATDAASEPVIERANTSWGAIIDAEEPFLDALKVRIFVETRARLADLERHRGDVSVTATLPATPNATALQRAIDRVEIERADDDGTALAATVENVTLTVRRDDRAVATRSISPEVTVATPVLAMHERVSEYERRLNAGIDTPGLTQRLTAQISAVAWARGWAQNRGAPIENVIANRHVELATNAAALDIQRTTIGHVDRDGLARISDSGLAVAGQDVLAATEASDPVKDVGNDLAEEIRRPGRDPITVFEPPGGSRGDTETVVGVNRTADDQYLDYIDGDLDATIESVYTAQSRVETAVWNHRGGKPSPPGSPGSGWERVDERHRTSAHVSTGSGSPPTPETGWDRLEGYVRDVRLDHERERVWRRNNETRTTTSSRTERATVGIALLRYYGGDASLLGHPVKGLYDRGAGPLSGPNLAGIDDRAREQLIDGRGGPDSIATRAVRGSVDESAVDITGERPDGLREWILTDLNGLRERFRNETAAFERDRIASFDVNPAWTLARRLEGDRRAIVDPPTEFDGVADRARIAARAAYHDRVRGAMDRRARAHRQRAGEVGDHLGGVDSIDALGDHARTDANRGSRRLPTISGPDGPVRLRVDTAPSYLTLVEIDSGVEPAANGTEHPLVARNVNVFTVPHGDVSDAIGNVSIDELDRTRLDTAARALRTANDTLDREWNATLDDHRDRLHEAVTLATQNVRTVLATKLVQENAVNRSDAMAVVQDGLARWNSTHATALALANGSAAAPIVAEVGTRDDVPEHETDRLRLVLDRAMRDAVTSSAGRPFAVPVNDTVTSTSEVAEGVFDRAIEELDVESTLANETFSHLPAGLPLAPVPGSWYATTNVWTVTVRGEYARFGVRTTRADPTTPGSEVAYVRDGGNATVDVDGDGEEERLGQAGRVSFEAHAGTAVLVPPGPEGVGDVDGERNETSSGWPAAGPK